MKTLGVAVIFGNGFYETGQDRAFAGLYNEQDVGFDDDLMTFFARPSCGRANAPYFCWIISIKTFVAGTKTFPNRT